MQFKINHDEITAKTEINQIKNLNPLAVLQIITYVRLPLGSTKTSSNLY